MNLSHFSTQLSNRWRVGRNRTGRVESPERYKGMERALGCARRIFEYDCTVGLVGRLLIRKFNEEDPAVGKSIASDSETTGW